MADRKFKLLDINAAVYVYNSVNKKISKGVIKRVTLVFDEEHTDITYLVLIVDEKEPYCISMNEDFVWTDRDSIIDFATNLIKDL